MTRSPVPLDVTGTLLVTAPGGETFPVEGRGDSIHVRLPDLRTARRLRSIPPTSSRSLHALAKRAGVSLEVTIGRWITARWAPGVRPGLVSRLLGCAPFRLSFGTATSGHGDRP